MKGGKILRIKYGYNPNSSSIGSDTGPIEDIIKNQGVILSNHSFLADIRYFIGICIAQLIVLFTARYFYILIKLKLKNKIKKIK